mmetsp:Transcript_18558/g.50731  ORF Transcript_18558/g.50731 Transcript_18558/m.50731 type:complete len:206 (-) Transcript_18558:74-691(-)
MDTVLGVEYNGGVILACDQSNARSILLYQTNLDKIRTLTTHSAMGVSGPQCDSSNFTQYISKNLQLYQISHNKDSPLSMHAQANFTRNELATALRKGPYQVNVLLGGVDPATGESSLYFLDYLAALQKIPYGAQGYASNFCLSIFDRCYVKSKAETTEQEAVDMIHKCIKELKLRFLIAQPNFIIKAIDKEGVRVVSQDADPMDT